MSCVSKGGGGYQDCIFEIVRESHVCGIDKNCYVFSSVFLNYWVFHYSYLYWMENKLLKLFM